MMPSSSRSKAMPVGRKTTAAHHAFSPSRPVEMKLTKSAAQPAHHPKKSLKQDWKSGKHGRAFVSGPMAAHRSSPAVSPAPPASAPLLSSRDIAEFDSPAVGRNETAPATAVVTAIATAIHTPMPGAKSDGLQVSALSMQLEALAVNTRVDSATQTSPTPSTTEASVKTVPPTQDVVDDSYEVRIDHEFVSLKATDAAAAAAAVDTQFDRSFGASSRGKMSTEDFEPIRYLGKGGFGTVVLVRQKCSGRLFAQKQLRKESLLVYKRGAECAKTERNVLESINKHPFMVKLFYAFQDDVKLYLLLEYAQGGELFQHLREERMLPETTVSFYMAEIVLALEFLHEKVGVVYRDLKPENCLLDADGHLLLTDFGLCKEGVKDGQRCNTFTGTVAYMAPEVIEGKDYGFSVDWWSLGAIGIDLLTGSPPFRGGNDKMVRDKITKAKLTLPMYLSLDAKDIFIRLLRKDPRQRLGSKVGEDMRKIKSHRFFRKIDWASLARREMEPPIKPFITDPELAENFDEEFTAVPVTPSDEHFRSNIDEVVYRSRNPSPNKPPVTRKWSPANQRAKRARAMKNGQTAKVGTDDGDGELKEEEEEEEEDEMDPDGLFGGFSFTARASVFEDATFWA